MPPHDDAPLARPYHRLAAGSWLPWRWRVLGLVVVLGLGLVLGVAVLSVGYALHEPRLDSRAADGDLVWELVVVTLGIAALVPATLLTARWIDHRPAGSLSSVTGKLRWGWLAQSALVCSVVALVASAVALALEPPPDGFASVDWQLVALIAGVGVVTVPLQAAGEEYLFRGYLAQLAGSLLKSPWVPAAVLSLLFALLHGTEQDIWSFVDRAFFGLVAAWLTIRTGGLEAAISLHALGNIAAFVLLTVDGELQTTLTGPEPALGAGAAAVDMALVGTVAFVLTRLARRHPALATTAPALTTPGEQAARTPALGD